jgi:hypothetical protein
MYLLGLDKLLTGGGEVQVVHRLLLVTRRPERLAKVRVVHLRVPAASPPATVETQV